MEVHFDLSGFADDEVRLVKMIALLRDLRLFWPRLSALSIEWISRQFDDEGEAFGAHWAPLSPRYLTWKMRNYPGKRILQIQGDLRRAATTPTRVVSPQTLTLIVERYTRTDRRTGRVAEIDPAWFQRGTTRMPARPILPTTSVWPTEFHLAMDRVAQEWVNEMMGVLGIAGEVT